jgi:erythromycin esterase-like protein
LSSPARATLDELRLAAQPLTDGEAGDYDALLKLIGKARLVLLGASCQGTHEFFLGWLRNYNDRFEGDRHKVRVGGLDIDSLTKTVVWAHSREVGDARATDQSESTIGQMARERRLARMVDSVYRADTTSDSYLRARLVDHFDALVHFDATRPREPIDPNPG